MDIGENERLHSDWRSMWLSSLQELSDIELQQCWLNQSIINLHWSYIEFHRCYFSDLWLSDNYREEIQEGYVTQEEYDYIKDFHHALKNYEEPNNNPYDHSAILKDATWQEIMLSGRKAIDRLAVILTDYYEKRYLLERPTLQPYDFIS